MKRISFFLLVIILLHSVLFAGCDIDNNSTIGNSLSTNFTNQTNTTNTSASIYYFDDENINIDGVHFTFSCSEINYTNPQLTITLTAVNTNLQNKLFSMNENDIKIVDETNGVEYKCLSYLYGNDTLQYNIIKNYQISSTLPTSYKNNNYHLKIKIFNKEYIIKLYETPDELRVEHSITFKVYSYPNYTDVNQNQIVKHNRTANKYIWEDNNHMYYCDKWYLNEERNYTETFYWGTKITNDITLYGLKQFNISYTRDNSGTHIKGINHVPSDGVLVIDSYYGDVYITNNALYNNNLVKEIYLPKELKRIYSSNFEKMSALVKIHFEGTETEWNNIQSSSSIPSNVSIIFNSKYQ